MAKKQRKGSESVDLVKEEVKLDLVSTLTAIDKKDLKYFSNLNEELKKKYTPFVLMRFISSSPNTNGQHEASLILTNEIVNKDYWSLYKYPELQHMLMCICTSGAKTFHKWIPNKKEKKQKWVELLYEKYKTLNREELAILQNTLTVDDISQLALDLGKSEKEAKEYAKSFKETN